MTLCVACDYPAVFVVSFVRPAGFVSRFPAEGSRGPYCELHAHLAAEGLLVAGFTVTFIAS